MWRSACCFSVKIQESRGGLQATKPLKAAYIIGNFAEGINSDTIEPALVRENLDTEYIDNLISKAEKHINRKIVYLIMTQDQMQHFFNDKPILLIWEKDD